MHMHAWRDNIHTCVSAVVLQALVLLITQALMKSWSPLWLAVIVTIALCVPGMYFVGPHVHPIAHEKEYTMQPQGITNKFLYFN